MRSSFHCIVLALAVAVPDSARGQCLSAPAGGRPEVFKTTGDLMLDQTINQEAALLGATFDVRPDLYALMDGNGANAFADCERGTVLIGLRLLKEELWSMDKGPLAVAGIMAHEFSHIFQCAKHTTLDGKERELQADFLAGWYLGKQKAPMGFDVSGFARSVWQKGDYQFRSPLHHGTPDQRVNAMAAGFNSVATDADEAYDEALAFVTGKKNDPYPGRRMCKRRTPCRHVVPCLHAMPCRHPLPCSHAIPCRHFIPCQHPVMTPYGMVPMHQSDPIHQADPMHDADPMHPLGDPPHPLGDPEHPYDEVEETCPGG